MKIKRDHILILLLYLYVFSPDFNFLVLSTKIILLLCFLFYSIYKHRKFLELINYKFSAIFILGIVMLVLYGVIVSILKGFPTGIGITNSKPFIDFYTGIVQVIILGGGFAILLTECQWDENKLLNSFVKIAVAQSIIAILMILVPQLREYVFGDLMNITAETLEIPDKYFSIRVYGIANKGYYMSSYPIFQGLAIGIILTYAVEKKYNYLFYLPLVLVSIFFNARIGLIGIVSFILAYGYLSFKKRQIIGFLNKVFKIALGVILIAFISYFVIINTVDTSKYETAIKWMTSGFDSDNFGHLGTIKERFLFFPESIPAWLFGEGRYVHGGLDVLKSDIGYINNLFFGGLIYSLILYIAYGQLILGNNKGNNVYRTVSIIAFFIIFLSNIKGRIFTNNAIIAAVILMVFVKILSDKKKEVDSENLNMKTSYEG